MAAFRFPTTIVVPQLQAWNLIGVLDWENCLVRRLWYPPPNKGLHDVPTFPISMFVEIMMSFSTTLIDKRVIKLKVQYLVHVAVARERSTHRNAKRSWTTRGSKRNWIKAGTIWDCRYLHASNYFSITCDCHECISLYFNQLLVQ